MNVTSMSTSIKSCWVELNRKNLAHNVGIFRTLIGDARLLAAVVKSDAYGHGMVGVARTALEAGVDWLHVFSVAEGVSLRAAGVDAPVLVLGPAFETEVAPALDAGLRLTVADAHSAKMVAEARIRGKVHLKLETGTNRQGLRPAEVPDVVAILSGAGVVVEGAYTHYADIEDTTDHSFANDQLERFRAAISTLRLTLPHTACSAAAILFPDTYFKMVRVGIALYGLWPSAETRVSAQMYGRNTLDLAPVMTWKTRVSQIKTVPAGEYIGYGRTYRCTRDSRVAILPVGYADGYPRALSNVGHVLIHGMRAPVRGRICMNLSMVDVTDIPQAAHGDEVVLLGKQGSEQVTADALAKLAGTINYEIVTRAAPGAPRIWVD